MEKKIIPFLDSVLKQTYTNVEAIFVDDGSADKTKEIIYSYQDRLEALGMKFNYIYQNNSGAAVAVRTGLDYVNGKYLIWPDADDILIDTSIEKKVDFLENHSEYEWVRSNAYCVNSNDIKNYSNLLIKSKNLNRSLVFNEFIRFKGIYCPGTYMIRWDAFLKINPEKYIYPTYFGQNIQLTVPMAYHYKCGYIDEPLYVYIIYNNSHSHSNNTYEKKIVYSRNVEEILLNTLNKLNLGSRSDIYKVKNDFTIRRFILAYKYNNSIEKINEYKKLSFLKKINPIFLIAKSMKRNKFIDMLLEIYNRVDILLFRICNRK